MYVVCIKDGVRATDGCVRPLSLQVTEHRDGGGQRNSTFLSSACVRILYPTRRHRAHTRGCERKTVL